MYGMVRKLAVRRLRLVPRGSSTTTMGHDIGLEEADAYRLRHSHTRTCSCRLTIHMPLCNAIAVRTGELLLDTAHATQLWMVLAHSMNRDALLLISSVSCNLATSPFRLAVYTAYGLSNLYK